jgi:acetyl-CoA decarbonylase/synthase, CODH/ACS complex subunit delta
MSIVEIPKETWSGKVREVTLGAGASEGGTRASTVTVGGETTLPFLAFEGVNPHPPVLAVEINDVDPGVWSPELAAAWEGVAGDPAAWAAKAVAAGAELLVLRLRGAHPDFGDASAEQCAHTTRSVLDAVGVPLVVYGCGVAEKDNEALVAIAEEGKGERLALGLAEDKNYRTIVAAALGNGHAVVAFSPIDVNLAKQLNILISDMGLPLDRVLMDPNTGALGYGIEYTYSVMERLRMAALMGDAMTQQPMICNLGEESWRQKESRVADGVPASWGALATRAPAWEVVTALTMLEGGADIAVLRHPASVAALRDALDDLTAAGADGAAGGGAQSKEA